MLKGSNSVRVIVLAALVLAVAFSSTLGSKLSPGRATAATTVSKQSRHRAAQQQKLNSAWQEQLSTEKAQLQQAQAQQQQAASAPSTLSPPAPAAAPAAPAPSSGGSVADDIQAAFGPLGATAVQWGLCIAQHESGDDPNAVQAGPGGALGLFQFEPDTWAATPQGQAGASVFDPVAASQAAAAFYAAGNYDAWTTNAAYCSMYD